jgi:Protein of unknown function (DUF998)
VKASRVRSFTIAAFLCSVACVAILHIARTDLSPTSHRLSEYANGPYGWMMTTAFAALAIALVALGISLRGGDEGIARAAPLLAFLAAAGTILSAVFKTGGTEAGESIHSRASAIAVVSIVVLAIAHSVVGARRAPDVIGVILAFTAGIVACISPLLHETRWTGLSQRLLWMALIGWLLWTAWHATPEGVSENASRRSLSSHRSNDAR